MKNYRRILAVVLTVVLAACLLALPVMAADETGNGLELTLTTDKTEYASAEAIHASLTVKNTTETAVSELLMQHDLAEGVTVKQGEVQKFVASLGAGESVSLDVTLEVDVAAETGDFAVSAVAVALVVSGLGVALLCKDAKVRKSVISVFLCCLMVGGLFAAVPVRADSAVQTVSTVIKVNGQEITLNASVAQVAGAYGSITDGLDFETEGQELWFVGAGESSDATVERVSYADLGITAPANGDSYALKVSHTSKEFPTFRINFGKTLKAGTQIKFDAYAVTDGSAISLMLQDHEWKQVAYLVSSWRENLNWEATLLEDCDHIDLVWERRGATEVPSGIIIDNIVATEPEPEPTPVEPVGDIIAGLDFETSGNELWFVGAGENSDATVERVSYADLGIAGPANGGSYALKVSHTSNEFPTFRINFGKTLKAGTQIKFDAYAVVAENAAISLMLQDHSWQQVAYLVPGWREGLSWDVTLPEDCDHIDLVWERRNTTEVPSSIIIDNIVATEPEPDSIVDGLDFETEGHELWFVGAGEGSDATVERVSYADLGIAGTANGGSYALKVSHTSNEFPTFRINFGKTLKAGTQIKFDAYAVVAENAAISLMLQDHSWQQVAYLVPDWREGLSWDVTLPEDCDHIDLVWERRNTTEVPSSIIIDNIVAVEPN